MAPPSSRPPLAGAMPPRATAPFPLRTTGQMAIPAIAATPPPPSPVEDLGGKTMIFDGVMHIPKPRPGLTEDEIAEKPPSPGTQRFTNVLPVPNQSVAGAVAAEQKKTSARMAVAAPPPPMPAPTPPTPAPTPPAPTPPAAPPSPLASVQESAPSTPAASGDDEVGGRTMSFDAVINIPKPPEGAPAPDEAGDTAVAELEKAGEALRALRRTSDEPEPGVRALLVVLVVVILGAVLFAAGYAVSQAAAQRRLDEAIGKARGELEHGNPAGALLILGAMGASTQANAEAQSIRGRALLLTKKPTEAQAAIQLGLRDRNASAKDKANLQAIDGEAGLARGNAQEAVRALKEATDQDPKNPTTHRLLGEAYTKLEQWVDAKRELDEALRLDPATPRARLVRAQVCLRLGERDDAEKDLESAAQGNSDPEALLLRADLKLRRGDVLAALEDAATVERIVGGGAAVTSGTRPQDAITWRKALLIRAHAKLVQGDGASAQNSVDELRQSGFEDDDELRMVAMRALSVADRTDDACKLALAPRITPVEANPVGAACDAAERALVLLSADRIADALALLDQAPAPPGAAFHAVGRVNIARATIDLARGADRAFGAADTAATALADTRALGGGSNVFVVDGVAITAASLEPAAALLAGRAALRAGDETRAQAFFDKAVAAAPRSPVPLVARATERLRRGETAKAISDLDAALSLAPDDPDVLRRRAAVALSAQDANRAISLLTKAASVGGRDPYLHLDRSRAEEMLGQHQPALAALERARELGLPQLCYAEGRARIALGQGELESADHWLTRVLDKRPFDLDALEARARVRAARGNAVQASQDYVALRSLAPRVEYDRALARLYMDRGELKMARALLQGSLERAPKDAELHGLMGRLARIEHRWVDAEKSLRTAVTMNPVLAEATLDLSLAMLHQGQDGAEFLLRRARELSPEGESEAVFLRECEELLAENDFTGFTLAAKGARALAVVNPKLRAAHAIVLKACTARKDWQALLEGAIRCLAAFPNDPEGLSAKKDAIKHGAKEGFFGGKDTDSVPPPVQPPKRNEK